LRTKIPSPVESPDSIALPHSAGFLVLELQTKPS